MDKSLYVLGGAAWINLLNTIYNSNKQPVDILQDPAQAYQWMTENKLLRDSDAPALQNKELSASLIAALQSFRELSSMILADVEQHGQLSHDVKEQLQRLVEQLKVSVTLAPMEDKWLMVCQGNTARDHLLYTLASSVIDTLNHFSADRIRKCEHDECILHFLDTSKSGKRRWCSMETCGNRQKAAEFYARKRKQSEKREA